MRPSALRNAIRNETSNEAVRAACLEGGAMIHRGPSPFTGEPMWSILSIGSSNAKTGPSLQTWHLQATIEPHQAVSEGSDEGACGTCPLRAGRGCYVTTHFAPLGIHRKAQRDGYPTLGPDDLAELARAYRAACEEREAKPLMRWGAYGEPTIMPIGLIRRISNIIGRHTGYTHAWMHDFAAEFRDLFMASTHNADDTATAQGAGWRTFRVRADDQPIRAGEVACPASDEGGKRMDCATCQACDGADRDGKVSITIIGHGGIAAKAQSRRLAHS